MKKDLDFCEDYVAYQKGFNDGVESGKIKERERILDLIDCDSRMCMECQFFDYVNDADTEGPGIGYCQVRDNRRHGNEAD